MACLCVSAAPQYRGQAEPCAQPEDCGIHSALIPDYALRDMNPSSPVGSTSRSDHGRGHGHLLLGGDLTALPCAAAQLQDIVNTHADVLGPTKVFIINMMGTEMTYPDRRRHTAAGSAGHIDDRVVQCFGASKWYVYVVDRAGEVRFLTTSWTW